MKTLQACILYIWLDFYTLDISEKRSFCISGTEFLENWTEFLKNRTEFSNNFVAFVLDWSNSIIQFLGFSSDISKQACFCILHSILELLTFLKNWVFEFSELSFTKITELFGNWVFRFCTKKAWSGSWGYGPATVWTF